MWQHLIQHIEYLQSIENLVMDVHFNAQIHNSNKSRIIFMRWWNSIINDCEHLLLVTAHVMFRFNELLYIYLTSLSLKLTSYFTWYIIIANSLHYELWFAHIELMSSNTWNTEIYIYILSNIIENGGPRNSTKSTWSPKPRRNNCTSN